MVHGMYNSKILGSNISNKLTQAIVIQLYVFRWV
jgi:hypothetical protein